MGFLTTSFVTTSAAARLRPGDSPRSQLYVTTGGAVAGAGILALGLVAAPPHVDAIDTEVRAVQLSVLSLPPAAHLRAFESLIGEQLQLVVRGAEVVVGGPADIPAAAKPTPTVRVTTPMALDSGIDAPLVSDSGNDRTTNTPMLASAALAASTGDYDWTQDPVLYPIISFGLGVLLFVVPVILAFVLWPVLPLLQAIQDLFQPPAQPAVDGASIATVDVNGAEAPQFTTGPLPHLSSVDAATSKSVNPEATAGRGQAGVAVAVKATEPETSTEQMTSTDPTSGNEIPPGAVTSTVDVTEYVEVEQVSTEATVVDVPDPPAGAVPSEPGKPAGRAATPRPLVRDSLGLGEKLRDRLQSADGARPTTRPAEAGDGADKGGPSTGASSSDAPNGGAPTGRKSTAGGSSGGEAGES